MSVEEPKLEVRNLQLESTNFRVNSDGWVKKTSPNGQEHREASTGDIWELINCKDPRLNRQQLFTWDAAMRETKKAGKRMPTEEEWDQLLKAKEDMPNLLLAGYRYTNGLFFGRGAYALVCSSLESGGLAWRWYLYSGYASVYRSTSSTTYGFSVRCLKSSPKL